MSPNAQAASFSDSPLEKLRAYIRSNTAPQAEDGLDDYNGDFRSFSRLGGIETADMRHHRHRAPAPESADVAEASGPDAATPSETQLSSVQTRPIAFDASRCLHRHGAIKGCNRCIDGCAYHAISDSGGGIEIDADVCMACACCTTLCPSGALQWVSDDLNHEVRHAMQAYNAQSRRSPLVIFYPAEDDDRLRSDVASLSPEALLVRIEPIGRISMEVLLATLARGAAGAWIAVGHAAAHLHSVLAEQVYWARIVLKALEWPETGVGLVALGAGEQRPDEMPKSIQIPTLKRRLPETREKRALLLAAVQTLAQVGRASQTAIPLPAGAPFGTLRIDHSRCTLCMACAGACAVKALRPVGGDSPGLMFSEAGCVQCGLCAQVCPEQALTLAPRLAVHTRSTREVRLHGEQPARCIVCDQPFASAVMVERMRSRLRGNPAYQNDEQLRRLQMCTTCRVRDFYAKPGGVK